jgi:glucose-6-phosphate dehydrogenase assembly protein OpcA
MSVELTGTNAGKIAGALLQERRKAGSPAMGMVLTFVVVTNEEEHYDAFKAAKQVSREHPARILCVVRRSGRGSPNLDAEVRVGEGGGSGESVLLRVSGELAKHAESVVLPLLLPDSPVVVWWPGRPPEDPANDPVGRLAIRRVTDTAAIDRGRPAAMVRQAQAYQPGNTDLSWTRLTPWRALLAAALDQYPAKVSAGSVAAERSNASADLLVAWLCHRLGIDVERRVSKGPGITNVRLTTGGGDIEISRPDGLLADFSIPNAPHRPVALKRREIPELLAEELRRLDPDDVYADTVQSLCLLAGVKPMPRRSEAADPNTSMPAPSRSAQRRPPKRTLPKKAKAEKVADAPSAAERAAAGRTEKNRVAAARRAVATKGAAKKGAAKKTVTRTAAATRAARRGDGVSSGSSRR